MRAKVILKHLQLVFCIGVLITLQNCDLSSTSSYDRDYHVKSTAFSAETTFSYKVPLGAKEAFNLRAVNGVVNIIALDNLSEARVWGKRRVESESRADAEKHLEYLEVDIVESENQLSVQTNQPSCTEGRNYYIYYNVEIPTSWETDVSQVNGDVEIDSLKGTLYAQLVNGDIKVRKLQGNCDIDLTNGRIIVDMEIPANGWCRLSNTNGQVDLVVPKTTSALLDARTVNGTISVSGLPAMNVVSSLGTYCCTLGGGQGTIDIDIVNGTISVAGI